MSSSYFLARKLSAVVLDTPMSATEGLWVGVAGNASIRVADPALQFNTSPNITVPLTVGFNPISVTQVNSAGTTATGIFAVY